MREVTRDEKHQRGCDYCRDLVKIKGVYADGRIVAHKCKHDECPYHNLDGVSSYAEYLSRYKTSKYNSMKR